MRARYAGFAVLAFLLLCPTVTAQALPDQFSNKEFWSLVTRLSEPDGSFFRQYMSNEDSAQFVIPELKRRVPARGVYLGVGLEQNFTYIAALQPRIAFIVDIRRDNMLQHLMYKALFELSKDRAEFLSRLLSRKQPAGLADNLSVSALVGAYEQQPDDPTLFAETLRAVLASLTNEHEIELNSTDSESLARILMVFRTSGLQLRGQGDSTNPTFGQLLAAGDLEGSAHGFLASEENFRILQQLQRKNLVVPLVGDFAGPRALIELGTFLKERGASVNVFYVSNVERYLFDANPGRFYTNVAGLPLLDSSVFIRAVTSDISERLGIPVPNVPAKWRTFIVPVSETLADFKNGALRTYADLFRHIR
jgi:hypothetical protein